MKRFVFILLITLASLLSCASKEESYEDPVQTAEIQLQEAVKEDVFVEFINHNDYVELGINDGMNEVIKEYFVRYFSAFGDFTDVSFDDIYYFDTEYERGIINTMVAYQNQIRRDMAIDLGYGSATVGVTYRSVTETPDGLDVYLSQNNSMKYNFVPDSISYTSDVEHHFILKEIEGKYYIVKHSEISGVYELITQKYDDYLRGKKLTLANLTPVQIRNTLEDLKTRLVHNVTNELKSATEQRDEYNSDPNKFNSTLTASNTYNVSEALRYSYEWVGQVEYKRNPEFSTYDEYGGNCNNYTSQCLLAGGIPMDISGKQWKWYGDGLNNMGGRYGRSSSWTACEYFYDYCKENTGFGLVCDVEGNLYSGRPGDIIQYVSDGVGVHSVIITKVIYDNDGNVVDYLVNSNTTDQIDCPMSLYGYTEFRLIKIIGYNN